MPTSRTPMAHGMTAITALVSVTAVMASALPVSHAESAPTGLSVRDGLTQPVFSYPQAIREKVQVETGVDSDRDGKKDRVSVFVTRPKETANSLKVASIIEASPYYGGVHTIAGHAVDLDNNGTAQNGAVQAAAAPAANATVRRRPPMAGARSNPGPPDYGWSYYDNYFVPRGYAVLAVDSLGTGDSTGCPTSGSRAEGEAMRSVVDWLNGRAHAYAVDGREVKADWSTGNAGFAGMSYNGTLANQVATTGVPGLRTVVSIGGISSWYDYYRANGGVVAPEGYQGEDVDVLAQAVRRKPEKGTADGCAGLVKAMGGAADRDSGDYSDFWQQRDYAQDTQKVQASVFVVHGLHDWNVRTKQFSQWYTALAKRGVPHKLWLHQGGHHDPRQVRMEQWFTTVHRWFDRWLYGMDNGVTSEPRVDVEESPGVWRSYQDWPDPTAKKVALTFATKAETGQPGLLDTTAHGSGRALTYTDNPGRSAAELVADPDRDDPNRQVYVSPPLKRSVRLSGTPWVETWAAVDGASPYLTALLVDYGEEDRYTGVRKSGKTKCVGASVEGNSGCFAVYEYTTARSGFEIVSRGWLDIRNRRSISSSEAVQAREKWQYRWDLQPQDHVFPAGHRIGVVLISTDREYTLRHAAGTKIAVQLGLGKVELPIVDGDRGW